MNVRTSLRLATLVALLVAIPTTLQGAPGGQSIAPTGAPAAANAPTAAEAARLAAAAADMAQRAAQLASAAEKNSSQATASPAWRTRGAAASQSATSTIGNDPNTGSAAAAPAADSTDGAFQWRRVFAQSEEAASDANAQSNPASGIAAPAARTINDSEVVPAGEAQYPETLAADAQFSIPATYEAGAACGDGCCEVECCPPPRTLFWTAGVEATFLNPDLNDDMPTFAVEDVTFDRFTSFAANSADVDSFYVSPRIWLGIQGCCWGTQVRYWHMQASEFEFDGFFDNSGSSSYGIEDAAYFSSGRLDAYTVDWEVTRRFCVHSCDMMLSGGLRYAMLETDSSVTGLVETLTDPQDLDSAAILSGYGRSDALTRGTGLVLGLYGRQPLFPCSCVHLFWNLRGSVLWGTTDTSAESYASVAVLDPDADAVAGSVNSADTCVDDDMFIGEVQLGLEWDYCLCCVPANAFFRCAVEYQRWDGGPGTSSTGSFAAVEVNGDDAALVETTANAFGPQLDLVGLALSTGLTW